ncbi:MAG: ferrous iron transport protein B [Peptostreptococcaceae bacterium]|nr:ferrous iron transport protein B [Peptostreptococcaceae bacterium]
MNMKIALAGNPNSGKTTMFNELTGSSQYVGNWPGVTVEKKEGKLKGHKDITIVDLPGIYSLSPYTLEEVVARNFIMNEKPEAIINIVDSTNIERNLYLTTQLLEMGTPIVIALNMTDLLEKSGDKIDKEKLSKMLGCPVIETTALRGKGATEVAQKAIELANQKKAPDDVVRFEDTIEEAIASIEQEIGGQVTEQNKRWYAVKILENDKKAVEHLTIVAAKQAKFDEIRKEIEEKMDDDMESIITFQRYEFIGKIIESCVMKVSKHRDTTSDKIDRIVTNRVLGLPIFALVMFLVYYVSIATVGAWGTDWVNEVLFGEIVPAKVDAILESLQVADWMVSLIQDGIIAGVGAVLGFLPQMMVLFFMLSLLEDSGYMARVAFVMDRIFRKFGLSGKSFIPMLIGTGCSVPGIMASRTIENERDRKITIMTTSFIPCSAKLPIIALIAGALFDNSAMIGYSAYVVGIATVIISGIMLKKMKAFAGDPAPFVMELPPYHIPSFKGVVIHMWDRAKSFVKKAGTIIFLASALIWFLSSFNWSFEMVDAQDSILAGIGNVIAPIFSPLGWGDWRASVAAITGLIAKENVVGTFGILYGGLEEVAEDGAEIWDTLRVSFTQLSAYSFLIFNLICAPCFAAIGAIKREMGNARWTWIALGFQTVLAYVLALIFYQFGMLFTGGGSGIGTIIASVFLIGIFYLLFRPEPKPDKITKH